MQTESWDIRVVLMCSKLNLSVVQNYVKIWIWHISICFHRRVVFSWLLDSIKPAAITNV